MRLTRAVYTSGFLAVRLRLEKMRPVTAASSAAAEKPISGPVGQKPANDSTKTISSIR